MPSFYELSDHEVELLLWAIKKATEKSRVVSEKLGMWKPRVCSVRNWYNPNHCGECGYQFPVGFNPRETLHDIPPPDFTTPTGADALMTAYVGDWHPPIFTAKELHALIEKLERR